MHFKYFPIIVKHLHHSYSLKSISTPPHPLGNLLGFGLFPPLPQVIPVACLLWEMLSKDQPRLSRSVTSSLEAP